MHSYTNQDTIKFRVLSQTIKLNGKTHTVHNLPIGEIIDAVPIYGDKNHTIIQVIIQVFYNHGTFWRSYPSELFLSIAKHRQQQIDSIFED
jgi:hypothetical protein